MSPQPGVAVLWGTLAWHPAVAAWRRIAPDVSDPERIEILRQRNKSATYRLVGAGPNGEAIIAQRSCVAKAQIERTVYEQILPHLPITTPHYYGSTAEGAERAWLFLEDVGDVQYCDTNAAHRAIAGRWVGAMHVAAARVPAARELPTCGPPRYLAHLRAARHAIQRHLTVPRFTADDVALLERIMSALDQVERQWPCLERACSGMPPTLVHGDFRPKNAGLRTALEGTVLYPFDWELAGWGSPAADLTQIDLAAYWSVVCEAWADVRFEDVCRLAGVGRVFQLLAACDWEAMRLVCEYPAGCNRPLASFERLYGPLADAVRQVSGVV
jgi:phosphotransferase family enzyme